MQQHGRSATSSRKRSMLLSIFTAALIGAAGWRPLLHASVCERRVTLETCICLPALALVVSHERLGQGAGSADGL
jgi:hypothetical protein